MEEIREDWRIIEIVNKSDVWWDVREINEYNWNCYLTEDCRPVTYEDAIDFCKNSSRFKMSEDWESELTNNWKLLWNGGGGDGSGGFRNDDDYRMWKMNYVYYRNKVWYKKKEKEEMVDDNYKMLLLERYLLNRSKIAKFVELKQFNI